MVYIAQSVKLQPPQGRFHGGLFHQYFHVFHSHRSHPFRLGAPTLTNWSPAPNRPSSHRCPMDAPEAIYTFSGHNTICESKFRLPGGEAEPPGLHFAAHYMVARGREAAIHGGGIVISRRGSSGNRTAFAAKELPSWPSISGNREVIVMKTRYSGPMHSMSLRNRRVRIQLHPSGTRSVRSSLPSRAKERAESPLSILF